jgi:hypothetical protein
MGFFDGFSSRRNADSGRLQKRALATDSSARKSGFSGSANGSLDPL